MALAQLTNALLLNVASCAAEIHGRPRSTQAHGKNRVPFLAATCVGAPTLHHRNVALCVGWEAGGVSMICGTGVCMQGGRRRDRVGEERKKNKRNNLLPRFTSS